jgi:hypothetical protein
MVGWLQGEGGRGKLSATLFVAKTRIVMLEPA